MYRLAILIRLRRRFPIQIAKEATTTHLVNGIDLPESPFIDSEGKFQYCELDQTPLMPTLARNCTLAEHPGAMGAVSGDCRKIITELLGMNSNDNNKLERDDATHSLVCRCREGYARPIADTAELSETEMATFAEGRVSTVFSNASAFSNSGLDSGSRPASQLMELNWFQCTRKSMIAEVSA